MQDHQSFYLFKLDHIHGSIFLTHHSFVRYAGIKWFLLLILFCQLQMYDKNQHPHQQKSNWTSDLGWLSWSYAKCIYVGFLSVYWSSQLCSMLQNWDTVPSLLNMVLSTTNHTPIKYRYPIRTSRPWKTVCWVMFPPAFPILVNDVSVWITWGFRRFGNYLLDAFPEYQAREFKVGDKALP